MPECNFFVVRPRCHHRAVDGELHHPTLSVVCSALGLQVRCNSPCALAVHASPLQCEP